MTAAKTNREPMLDVAMVDDDAGKLRVFADHARSRGDIQPHVTQFTWDVETILETVDRQQRSLDLVLLDVRLPQTPKEAKKTPEDRLPPRARDIAQKLAENPRTKHTRVVVMTKYAFTPDVHSELAWVEKNCPNVVRIYRSYPELPQAIHEGLKHVRHLDVRMEREPADPLRFQVFPGSSLTPQDFDKARFLLNGCVQTIKAPVRGPTGDGKLVCFDKSALFERDANYLLVELEGKKSIFPLNDPPS